MENGDKTDRDRDRETASASSNEDSEEEVDADAEAEAGAHADENADENADARADAKDGAAAQSECVAEGNGDMEASSRGRISMGSIIVDMAFKAEQEEANSNNDEDTHMNYALSRRELSKLTPAGMSAHICKLVAEVYELSQREARELTRSKHLRVFGNTRRRSSR